MDHRYIFVNTSGWLALYNPHDPNHPAASQLWQELSGQPVRLVSTDYVMEKVYTALKVFGSIDTAHAVHELIDNSALLRLFMTDSVIFERAWELFEEDEHPLWTYTDCVNYAVIEYLGVSEVLNFDPNFAAPNLHTIPAAAQEV